jgi:hypothetical protein
MAQRQPKPIKVNFPLEKQDLRPTELHQNIYQRSNQTSFCVGPTVDNSCVSK